MALAEANEPAPRLLDALARAPGSLERVIAMVPAAADRKALCVCCATLRDAVGASVTKLSAWLPGDGAGARPPTAERWPALVEISLEGEGAVAHARALGGEGWAALESVSIGDFDTCVQLDRAAGRALARLAPRLRELAFFNGRAALSAAGARALFRRAAWPRLAALTLRSEEEPPKEPSPGVAVLAAAWQIMPALRVLTLEGVGLTAGSAQELAAAGWRLEELSVRENYDLGDAGLAYFLAAPSFALRVLDAASCGLSPNVLAALAAAPAPLEALALDENDFGGGGGGGAAAAALAALARCPGLRRLGLGACSLRAASYRALFSVACPDLVALDARADVFPEEPLRLRARHFGADAFAALEELGLAGVPLGEAGARALASRPWPRLRELDLRAAALGDAGGAALAGGAWPALRVARLGGNGLSAAAVAEWEAAAPGESELCLECGDYGGGRGAAADGASEEEGEEEEGEEEGEEEEEEEEEGTSSSDADTDTAGESDGDGAEAAAQEEQH
jgi:hypothetical protein